MSDYFTVVYNRSGVNIVFDVAGAEYQCPLCKRTFPWRPEAAGRPVDCPCGVLLLVPFSPGVAETRAREPQTQPVPPSAKQEEPREILLCADCGAQMQAGDTVCANCGWHRPRQRRRIFRRGNQPNPDLQPPISEPLRDVAAPLVLAIAGLIVEIGLLGHAFAPPHNWADAVAVSPLLLLMAMGTIVFVLLGCLALSPVLDLSLGSVGPLMIKLAAAVLFPVAIGSLIYTIFGSGVSGIVIGWLSALVIYLALFRSLFDFDWPDAMLLIALISMAHAFALFAVLWPLTHGPLPMPELWMVFHPVVVQSIFTFLVAGGLVAPHLRDV